MSTNQDSRSKLLPWAIAAIVALVGTNIVTWANWNSKKSEVITTQTTLKSEEDLNAKLDQQFKDASTELEGMKGKNTELNSLIDKQKGELDVQKTKIANLINVKKDLAGARAELGKMKDQVTGYITQIADLQTKNKGLTENVATLTSEKTQIQTDLSTVKTAREQLASQNEALAQEKAKVEQERTMLARKVDIGSVVHVSNLTTKGYVVGGDGKEKERSHAGNINRIKFCFDAGENAIAPTGKETFYFRIIDPTGVAISTQTGGGGVLKLDGGKEVQYTTSKDVDYAQSSQNVCLAWDTKGTTSTLQKGKYDVEVYNKGYMAGKGSFELKK